jgi:hypothetical protein
LLAPAAPGHAVVLTSGQLAPNPNSDVIICDGPCINTEAFVNLGSGTIVNNPGAVIQNTGGIVNASGGITNLGRIVSIGSLDNVGGTITNFADFSNFASVRNTTAVFRNFGSIINTGSLANRAASTLTNEVSGTLTNTAAGTLTNDISSTVRSFGRLDNQAIGRITNDGTFVNAVTSRMTNQGRVDNRFTGRMTNQGRVDNRFTGSLENAGRFTNGVTGKLVNSGTFSNKGVLSDVRNDGEIENRGLLENLDGRLENRGSLKNASAGRIRNTGVFLNQGTLVNDGIFDGAGGSLTNAAGARLQGNGEIRGGFTDSGGVVAPGNSVGTLTFADDFELDEGVLEIEIVGFLADAHDVVVVGDVAALAGGTVRFVFLDGFLPEPAPLSSLTFLVAGTLAGPLPTFDFSLLGGVDDVAYAAFAEGDSLVFEARLAGASDVPAPASLPLFAVALLALGAAARRRRAAEGTPPTAFPAGLPGR